MRFSKISSYESLTQLLLDAVFKQQLDAIQQISSYKSLTQFSHKSLTQFSQFL